MKKLSLLLFVSLSFFIISSCEKEIEGCTNLDATNYESEATTDDGSCTYTADVVFWFNQSTMNHLNTTGANSVQLFVGTGLTFTWFLPMTSYQTVAPECGSNSASSVTLTYSLITDEMQLFDYSLETDGGTILMGAIFSASPNNCSKVELIY